MDIEWDCVVLGGGAAGLSAALVPGRARRRTLGHDGRPSIQVRAIGQSVPADDIGLPIPPWPHEKENVDAHA